MRCITGGISKSHAFVKAQGRCQLMIRGEGEFMLTFFFCNFDNSFHQCPADAPAACVFPDTEFQNLTGIAVVFEHDHAEHILCGMRCR